MSRGETLLEVALRHVREGEARVRLQLERVRHLEAARSPSAELARALQAEFAVCLESCEAHLAQIEAEQRSGWRDADGTLRPTDR